MNPAAPAAPEPAVPTPSPTPAAPSPAPADPRTALPDLARRASAAQALAYAPYSGYSVGAAVLTADGRVFTGCNVENAAYGDTVCAERVAVWSAVAAGARRLVAIAVVTPSGGTPCGACRQVLSEFSGSDLAIGVAARGQALSCYTLGDLLPHAWTRADLEAHAGS